MPQAASKLRYLLQKGVFTLGSKTKQTLKVSNPIWLKVQHNRIQGVYIVHRRHVLS